MKHIAFNNELQKAYDTLPNRVQRYVDLVGAGNTKSDSYKMAGFTGKSVSQSVTSLERSYPILKEMFTAFKTNATANAIIKGEKDELLDRQINALANQKTVEQMMQVIDNADAETALRIKFYREIIKGDIKSTKTTSEYDKEGNLVKRKVEEIDDVNSRITARKELDRVLGLNAVLDVGSLQAGDITINIVDASKKDEIVLDDKDIVVKGESGDDIHKEQGQENTTTGTTTTQDTEPKQC